MTFPLMTLVFGPPSQDNSGSAGFHSHRKDVEDASKPPYSLRNDPRWLEGLRAGDESIFADLVQELAPGLHAYAFQYVRSPETAEDVVQDVFNKIWEQREHIEVRSTLKQYLFIAIRCFNFSSFP